ncbi:MAG: glycosyltransferase family 2 protein [Epsilonproteobacteria bacterium]|nr:glycosyltransferase family 2 protein [Campylobacterota bacterium]
MVNPLSYFWHRFDPDNFTLVMTILVRNEADIIAANIKTHAKFGVDAFVVMDNGSTDGTREILSSLQNEYEITLIDQPKLEYKQKVWMTQLAFEAKRIYKADWIINNDADEFWIPKEGGTLKKHLEFKGSVLKVHRTNMLPTQESVENIFAFANFNLEVVNTILYKTPDAPNLSTILTKIGAKTIVNPHGLIKINSGNHSAEHLAFWKEKKSEGIQVYHYPIRSFTQFKRNIENRKILLQTLPHVRMGAHYKRWVKLLDKDRLEAEYEKFIFSVDEIDLLQKIGILRLNNNIRKEILFDL